MDKQKESTAKRTTPYLAGIPLDNPFGLREAENPFPDQIKDFALRLPLYTRI
jgi:hypothetical protein